VLQNEEGKGKGEGGPRVQKGKQGQLRCLQSFHYPELGHVTVTRSYLHKAAGNGNFCPPSQTAWSGTRLD
jgi:hypothetical protein